MKANSTDLRRYDDSTRMNHWAIVLLFIAAALSGLAFFHPSMYWFSNLFGGGTWTRILHPYFGLLMFLFFLGMFFKLRKDNVMNDGDREWLSKSAEMFRGNKDNMPPAGKYNAGQKTVFWLMSVSLLILVSSGVLFWHAWFPDLPILARRIGVVVHALSAVVLVLTVIVHVYAAIWVKGTTRAMTKGTVSRSWAQSNHPLWHRDMTQGGK
jgi:formate dehydrogenase subunit gamma